MYGMYILAPSLTLGWDLGQDGEFRNGKWGKLSHFSDVPDACTCTCTHNNVDLHVNVCGSPHFCGCVISAMAAS